MQRDTVDVFHHYRFGNIATTYATVLVPIS